MSFWITDISTGISATIEYKVIADNSRSVNVDWCDNCFEKRLYNYLNDSPIVYSSNYKSSARVTAQPFDIQYIVEPLELYVLGASNTMQ